MKNKLIVANWKMGLDHKQTLKLIEDLTKIQFKNVDLVLCPSSLYLIEALKLVNNSVIKIGAQNCAYKNVNAFTGEISAKQLSEIGCEFSIIGHSERRIYLHENGKEIYDKIMLLTKQAITPIICVGEDNISHNAHKTKQIISMQLEEVDYETDWSKIIIAYEPIWAIGSGVIPEISEIADISNHIKSKVNPLKILYGGSVNAKNIKDLMSISCIDGFLIGSASMRVDELTEILNRM